MTLSYNTLCCTIEKIKKLHVHENSALESDVLVTGIYLLPVCLCRPIINSKFEDKTCGDGPSLSTMFDDDKYLQTLIQNIRV